MTRAVLFILLAVVATAAAMLSFAALDELGQVCGFGPLSPLLPLVLDAGAAAGTVAWLPGLGCADSGVQAEPTTRSSRAYCSPRPGCPDRPPEPPPQQTGWSTLGR
jgi:hypothetical protein